MKSCFVKLGAEGKKIFLYKDKELKHKFKQVLWGDQLSVVEENDNGLLKVNWAPNSKDKKCTVYIPKEDTTSHRPLEIIFVDVGQGDGCVVIAPGKKGKERIVVIDAGPGSHMWEFLKVRFQSYNSNFNFEAAVLTHSDKDHYKGFKEIFADEQIGFNTVYHNGLVERPRGKDFEKLGGLTYDDNLNCNYLEELAEDREPIKEYFSK